ncbi:type II toxin-antitoxin system VapC family toxin [Desulfonema magnum]|uniref:PIN domain-containing protein n=1 Tax=Desulfonema magnum TaxID=45655 RepID=A0A975BLX7_9BACT|nr:PIN domain-containing protein [Desulfonema magnum]QTA87916.1 PIN domain-containing protein [Desulfonema magnum]
MQYFTDTGAWIVLADKKDRYHQNAKEAYNVILSRNISLVTTDYIFDETVTWLRYKIGHTIATDWGQKLLSSRMVEIVQIYDTYLRPAWNIFQKYSDQKFSFTDCTSFAVMKALGLDTAFGFDDHFRIMGLNLIPSLSNKKK